MDYISLWPILNCPCPIIYTNIQLMKCVIIMNILHNKYNKCNKGQQQNTIINIGQLIVLIIWKAFVSLHDIDDIVINKLTFLSLVILHII